MKSALILGVRNGLILIHAITLCRLHEVLRKMAVTDRYQPYAGGWGKMNVPWKVPRMSCKNPLVSSAAHIFWAGRASLSSRNLGIYLGENQLVQNDAFTHVGHCYTSHDDERADHEALRPRLEDQSVRMGRLADRLLFSPVMEVHCRRCHVFGKAMELRGFEVKRKRAMVATRRAAHP